MKTNDPLTIPPAILTLDNVTCSEKMLLALYLLNPEAKNHRALKALSVGPSGLKKIKRRLISKGLLRCTISGYRVIIPGLDPAPQGAGGHFVAELKDTQKANKVAPLSELKSLKQILQEHEETVEFLTHQPGGTFACTILRVNEATLRKIQSDLPDGPAKDELVAEFTARCNAFFALEYGLANLPRKQHRDLDRLIGTASPEQLASLRQRIEHGQLAGAKPTLLLEQLSKGHFSRGSNDE